MNASEDISNEDLIAELKKGKQLPRKESGRPVFKYLLIVVFVIFVIVVALRLFSPQTVSETTIHWHAKLKITEYGRLIVIPPSIGLLGDIEHPSNLHTHEADNIVHMEIPGPVKASQITLAAFFEVWGRAKSDIVMMFVNGRPNEEGFDYVMRDGDEIELVFK